MIIAHQYLIQFSNNILDRPCPHIPDAAVYLLTFLTEFLPGGFPLHPELTVPAFGTVVRKAKDCEGFRLALPPSLSVSFGKSPEFNQAALFFLQA